MTHDTETNLQGETPRTDAAKCISCGQVMRPTDYAERLRDQLTAAESALTQEQNKSKKLAEAYVAMHDKILKLQADLAAAQRDAGRFKYRCTKCGTLWRLNPPTKDLPNGSWSLLDSGLHEKPCVICDNDPEFLNVIEPVTQNTALSAGEKQ